MNPKIIFLIFILIAVILEVFADILFKKWTIQSKNFLLFLGLGLYFIGTIFWAISLKYEYISKSISLFTIINLIVIILIGVIYFKEDLSTINKIGMVLGVVSVVLIEI